MATNPEITVHVVRYIGGPVCGMKSTFTRQPPLNREVETNCGFRHLYMLHADQYGYCYVHMGTRGKCEGK